MAHPISVKSTPHPAYPVAHIHIRGPPPNVLFQSNRIESIEFPHPIEISIISYNFYIKFSYIQ